MPHNAPYNTTAPRFPCFPFISHPDLEGVVLRRNFVVEEVAENGDLLDDVVAHAGHLGEEEEGEEAGYAAEAAGKSAAGRSVRY